jgi:hypothetical protein
MHALLRLLRRDKEILSRKLELQGLEVGRLTVEAERAVARSEALAVELQQVGLTVCC